MGDFRAGHFFKGLQSGSQRRAASRTGGLSDKSWLYRERWKRKFGVKDYKQKRIFETGLNELQRMRDRADRKSDERIRLGQEKLRWEARERITSTKEEARLERERLRRIRDKKDAYATNLFAVTKKRQAKWVERFGGDQPFPIGQHTLNAVQDASAHIQTQFFNSFKYTKETDKGFKVWTPQPNDEGKQTWFISDDIRILNPYVKDTIAKNSLWTKLLNQADLMAESDEWGTEQGRKLFSSLQGEFGKNIQINQDGKLVIPDHIQESVDNHRKILQDTKRNPQAVRRAYLKKFIASINENRETAKKNAETPPHLQRRPVAKADEMAAKPVVTKKNGFAEKPAPRRISGVIRALKSISSNVRNKDEIAPFSEEQQTRQVNLANEAIEIAANEKRIFLKSHHVAAILAAAYSESSLGFSEPPEKNIFQHKPNWINSAIARGKDPLNKWEDNLWTLLMITHGGALNNENFIKSRNFEEASNILTDKILRPQAKPYKREGMKDVTAKDNRAFIAGQFHKHLIGAGNADIQKGDPEGEDDDVVDKPVTLGEYLRKINNTESGKDFWTAHKSVEVDIEGALGKKKVSDADLGASFAHIRWIVDSAPIQYGHIKEGRGSYWQKAEKIFGKHNKKLGKEAQIKGAIEATKVQNDKMRELGKQPLLSSMDKFPSSIIKKYKLNEKNISTYIPLRDSVKTSMEKANAMIKNAEGEKAVATPSHGSLLQLIDIDLRVGELLNSPKDSHLNEFGRWLIKQPAFLGEISRLVKEAKDVPAFLKKGIWTIGADHLPALSNHLENVGTYKDWPKLFNSITPDTLKELQKDKTVHWQSRRDSSGFIIFTPEDKEPEKTPLNLKENDPDALAEYVTILVKPFLIPGLKGEYVPADLSENNKQTLNFLKRSNTLLLDGNSDTEVERERLPQHFKYLNELKKVRNVLIKKIEGIRMEVSVADTDIDVKARKYLKLFKDLKTDPELQNKVTDPVIKPIIRRLLSSSIISLYAAEMASQEYLDNNTEKITKSIAGSGPVTTRLMREAAQILPRKEWTKKGTDFANARETQDWTKGTRLSVRGMRSLFTEAGIQFAHNRPRSLPEDLRKLHTGLLRTAMSNVANVENRLNELVEAGGEEGEEAQRLLDAYRQLGGERLTDIGHGVTILIGQIDAIATVIGDVAGSFFESFIGRFNNTITGEHKRFLNDPKLGAGVHKRLNEIPQLQKDAINKLKGDFKRIKESTSMDENAKKYQRRMAQLTAERTFQSIMLTYRFAGMLQGGQGGRAISNEDFENVYKALWSNGIHVQVNNLEAAEEEIDLIHERADIIRRTAHRGTLYTDAVLRAWEPARYAESRRKAQVRAAKYRLISQQTIPPGLIREKDELEPIIASSIRVLNAFNEEEASGTGKRAETLKTMNMPIALRAISKKLRGAVAQNIPIRESFMHEASRFISDRRIDTDTLAAARKLQTSNISLGQAASVLFNDNGTFKTEQEISEMRGYSMEDVNVVNLYINYIWNKVRNSK